jgi:hypothetical protein
VHCLEHLNITSVARLIDAAREGIPPVRQIGSVTRADIVQALQNLVACVGRRGVVDWENYYRTRCIDVPVSTTTPAKLNPHAHFAVLFSSESLDRLLSSYREAPLTILHLGTRAQTSLARIQVRSVGGLIDAARRGVAELEAAGKRTVTEIRDALGALSDAVRSDGSVDWITYAIARRFVILPEKDYDVVPPREFIRIFPAIAKQAVQLRYGSPELVILKALLLRSGKGRTLEQVGQQLHCTKAAVSLVLHKLLSMFRRSILHDDYSGCPFRFQYSFVAPLRKLQIALTMRKDLPLLYSDWEQILIQQWEVTSAEIASLQRFFLEILDIQLAGPRAERFQPILLPKRGDSSAFTTAARIVETLLRLRFPNGLSEAQLRERLQKRLRHPFSPAEVAAIATSISGVERLRGERSFRMRIDRLHRVSDQVRRLLRDKGSPMHVRQLTAELARIRRESGKRRHCKNVSSLLQDCKGLRPIGRTGYWILEEWSHIETRSIPDIVFDILRESKIPMTSAQLYPLITTRRTVAPRSISRMLLEDRRFRRSGSLAWELA